jgi:hypothetical protein
MSVDTGRRSAILGFGSAIFGAAVLTCVPARAEVDSGEIPQGAHALSELMERLRNAPRQRSFKTTPMILDHSDLWDDAALREVIAYRGARKQVWDNTDLASPVAESHTQFRQCAGVLFRASRLPRGVGHSRLRSPGALRPGDVGQIQACRDGGRRLQDEHAHRAQGGAVRAFRLSGPQKHIRARRRHDPGAAESRRRVHGLP